MAVVLIVEDGSIVPNANSYSTLEYARQYAEERGLVIPDEDEDLSVALIQGFDVVNSYKAEYLGSKVSCDQSGQWPRNKVTAQGCSIPSDSIPLDLIRANVVAGSIIAGGVEVNPVSDGKEVASERVEGAVDVSYFESGNISQKPILNAVDSLVSPYLRNSVGMVIGSRL